MSQPVTTHNFTVPEPFDKQRFRLAESTAHGLLDARTCAGRLLCPICGYKGSGPGREALKTGKTPKGAVAV